MMDRNVFRLLAMPRMSDSAGTRSSSLCTVVSIVAGVIAASCMLLATAGEDDTHAGRGACFTCHA